MERVIIYSQFVYVFSGDRKPRRILKPFCARIEFEERMEEFLAGKGCSV
jgi:hypothetical protein